MDPILPPTDLSGADDTVGDISHLLPVLKDFYGKKFAPKSSFSTKARKTAAEKILEHAKKRKKKS